MQASMGQRSAFCSSSSSRVAQLGRPRALPRVARRCAAQPQQQPAAPESQPQQQPQQQPRWPRQLSLAAAAPAALLLRAGATWAEEAADFEPAYNYPAPDDPVVTLLFTAAIGLLSVVTLGVRALRCDKGFAMPAPCAREHACLHVCVRARVSTLRMTARACARAQPTRLRSQAACSRPFFHLKPNTLGDPPQVIYLAVLSWVDSRQEKKDQETGPVKSLAEQQAEIK